tara:strand:+ start:1637 stop:3061 length:1425 start_codon:yes stop_codon:yes gene_type:complete
MGLLDGTTHKEYYQGNNFGNYQFVSLDDIISQFQVMYVGEDKIIPKIKRADVAFHAQRALAELSFDTFKSFKSQEIEIPPSLTMVLPHDYVNYTKLSSVDAAGIKHVLYPTKHTSNPFEIKQKDTGEYDFPTGETTVMNADFSQNLDYYQKSPGFIKVIDGVLKFNHKVLNSPGGIPFGDSSAVWQEIDVSQVNYVDISADGVAAAAAPGGVLRFGLSTNQGDMYTHPNILTDNLGNNIPASLNASEDIFDIEGAMLTWDSTSSTQEALNINVSAYNTVYILITSNAPFTSLTQATVTNTIDNLSVTNAQSGNSLNHASDDGLSSSTWTSYKSSTIAEDGIDDYRYEQHWLNPNERYGLDPEQAQVNGSFYIDQRLGKIHFSSNINGKTVILDYISDSLGTDAEMQVPKLAEDAMYKHILCDIMSARSNIGAGRLTYYKKDKFAAVRKAKLRLSNIKLEELTQILRGQSKIIKH